jgi:hypothetical protein
LKGSRPEPIKERLLPTRILRFATTPLLLFLFDFYKVFVRI